MEELDPKWIRVSSILAMIPTKDCDGQWGYPLQAINQEVLQRKKDLGTSVHAAIAAHCKDEFIPTSPKEEGYLESYLKWEREVKIEAYKNEERFYHEAMKLTGCVDMIGLIGGNRHLIDFKCTVAADPVKWPIQGALYHLLAIANKIPVEKTCLFVQLDPKGDLPKVHEYTITDKLMTVAISWYNSYMYLTNK
jgi:hypothetical protein